MKWPSRSPDLNSIENLWAILPSKVYENGKQYRTVAEPSDSIEQVWAAISADTLQTLVASIPARYIAVIERQGNKTKY